jgi:hypothetical protein
VAKRLLTSTFTAQALEFQAQHYGRVGGFAALAGGEDIDLLDRLPAAGSELRCVWNQPRLPVSAYLSRRARKRSCESASKSTSVTRACRGVNPWVDR